MQCRRATKHKIRRIVCKIYFSHAGLCLRALGTKLVHALKTCAEMGIKYEIFNTDRVRRFRIG